VPVVLGPTIPVRDGNSVQREGFFRAIVILFKPWRSVTDLKGADQSWEDAFSEHRWSPELLRIIDNIHVESQCRDARISYDEQQR
ncbi:hypothetical protein DENSPDRAFT_747751, partial [Dentipellis sp. KUC8613]